MGLDVSFYTNLQWIEEQEIIEYCYENECGEFYKKYENGEIVKLWAYKGFEEHNDKEGWYYSEYIDGFNAGSYGGYGMFRRELCDHFLKCVINHVWNNPYYYKDKPFYYLINFADNEGTISGKAFQKLKEDFRSHDFEHYDEWITKKYKQWKELVLQSDAVRFC